MSHSRIEEPELQCQEMINLAEQFLPLSRWGFQKSETQTKPHARVIYASESCRVQFLWSGWDMYGGNTMSIYYGRDSTTIDNSIIDLNGEVYYPWYDIRKVLNFLDDMSPEEAVRQLYLHGQSPNIPEKFKQSDLGKSLSSYQPEWLIRMHAAVWHHYGQRLFDIFDSHNIELWDKYSLFSVRYKQIVKSKPKFDSSKES